MKPIKILFILILSVAFAQCSYGKKDNSEKTVDELVEVAVVEKATISEMILGGEADGKIGAQISIDFSSLSSVQALCSESSGFVFEVTEDHLQKVHSVAAKHDIKMIPLGKSKGDKLIVTERNKEIIRKKRVKKNT